MPDLGKYAGTILSAWGITLLLVAALAGLSWVQARRARRALEAAEARRREGRK
jgi:heme exporter protein D